MKNLFIKLIMILTVSLSFSMETLQAKNLNKDSFKFLCKGPQVILIEYSQNALLFKIHGLTQDGGSSFSLPLQFETQETLNKGCITKTMKKFSISTRSVWGDFEISQYSSNHAPRCAGMDYIKIKFSAGTIHDKLINGININGEFSCYEIK